jgi:hypothetical protein
VDGPPPRDEWIRQAEEGTKNVQDSARWLLGVVAAGLLAGTQLSGLGRLELDQWRLWLAAGAAVTTVASVGWIVKTILDIQVSGRPLDLDKLSPEEWCFVHESGLMRGFPNYAAHLEQHRALQTMYGRMRDPRRPTLLVPSELSGDVLFPLLREDLVEMVWEERKVAAAIGWYRMIRRFHRAKRVVLAGGALAAISILVLTWAANPPPPSPSAATITIPGASP